MVIHIIAKFILRIISLVCITIITVFLLRHIRFKKFWFNFKNIIILLNKIYFNIFIYFFLDILFFFIYYLQNCLNIPYFPLIHLKISIYIYNQLVNIFKLLNYFNYYILRLNNQLLIVFFYNIFQHFLHFFFFFVLFLIQRSFNSILSLLFNTILFFKIMN